MSKQDLVDFVKHTALAGAAADPAAAREEAEKALSRAIADKSREVLAMFDKPVEATPEEPVPVEPVPTEATPNEPTPSEPAV